MSTRPSGRSAAFTLMELLVVIGIIAVLAGLAFPAYQHVTQNAKAAACLSNLRQLSAGLSSYLNDHDQIMPTLMTARDSNQTDVPVIDNTLNPYVPNPAVFSCPADNKHFYETTGTSYCWNVALNGQPLASLNFLKVVTDPTHIPIIYDKEGFHPYLENKVNILYADGHATKDAKFFTGN